MIHRGRERRYLKQEEVGFTRKGREENKMATVFQKEIDKQEAEIKKKMKGEAQKAFMKCGSRHKKARSRKLFHLRVER